MIRWGLYDSSAAENVSKAGRSLIGRGFGGFQGGFWGAFWGGFWGFLWWFFPIVVMLWFKAQLAHKVAQCLKRHIGNEKSNYCAIGHWQLNFFGLFCLQRVARLVSAGEPVGHIMSVLVALSIRGNYVEAQQSHPQANDLRAALLLADQKSGRSFGLSTSCIRWWTVLLSSLVGCDSAGVDAMFFWIFLFWPDRLGRFLTCQCCRTCSMHPGLIHGCKRHSSNYVVGLWNHPQTKAAEGTLDRAQRKIRASPWCWHFSLMFVTRLTTKVRCAGVDAATFFLFCGPVCLFDAPCTPAYDRRL